MLIPTNGCDGETVIHALINYWIRIFGYFKVFESDWGSGFSNLLIKYLSKMLDFDIELAEPRNHRSIGKVERTIGFLQSIINHYNLLLNNRLTDQIDNLDQAWLMIKTIIPFIQLAFNQRILPISGVSPNMVIFGTNMNDAIDIGRLQYQAKLAKDDPKLLKKDYEILENIRRAIRKMGAISHTNWKKNTYFSRKYYNKKYNINDEKIKRNLEIFKVGSKVLYYIGDKQVARGKWRAKWTGPWLVEKHLNQSTVIISDPTTGNQKRVSLDRLKLFKEIDFEKYEKVYKFNRNYINYKKQLSNSLKNYNVKFTDRDVELNYNKRRRNRKRMKQGVK